MLSLVRLLAIIFIFAAVQSRVIYQMDYDSIEPFAPAVKRNRLCLLNAGLSQGCDISDMLTAKSQASKFMSFAGPGRR